MSVKSRTIDNLGIETSSRYAQDKELLDAKLIEESRFIPLKTEVSALKPYLPTELQEYLLPSSTTLWAAFEPPPEYFSYANSLFSYQLIPSLGGSEKQDADTEKLEALEDILNQQQDDQERQEKERKRKTLIKFLKTLSKLDRTLVAINSRRSQYQRG